MDFVLHRAKSFQVGFNRHSKRVLTVLIALLMTMWASACRSQSEQGLIDTVASLVSENHYDQNLHGLNWASISQKYKDLGNGLSKPELILLADQMMQELGDSHCGVVNLADIEKATSPYLFGDSSVGIDLRLLENTVVVTRVEAHSSADLAGLRPGHELLSINTNSVAEIIEATPIRPPFTNANKNFHQTRTLLWHLYGGSPGAKVQIVFSRPGKSPTQVELTFEKRPGGTDIFPNMPTAFLTQDSRALEGGIQYLRFNSFQPENPTDILDTLDGMNPDASLIIDLRGNEGGSANATSLILSRFVQKEIPIYERKGRSESITEVVVPAGRLFSGKVVVLVDEMSISAAENLAGIMQHAGLATVIGSRTPGQLLWGQGFTVEENVMAVIPTARVIYPDGSEIEGTGLTPDIEVTLNRDELFMGIDRQLDTAIQYLKN